MKRNMKHIAWIAAGASMLFTACIGDLDTLPLNPSDSTSETVYGADESGDIAGLTKLYFNFVSNETTDLQVSDAGASELVRAFWTVQEVTSDACKCAWENDAWVRAMNTNTWSDADNDATYAVYVRTLQGIAYTNEYLRQTASDRLSDRGVSSELAAKIQGFRAEARFLRAYFYWMALDVFGDVPFTTENSPFGLAREPQAGFAQGCLRLLYLGADSPGGRQQPDAGRPLELPACRQGSRAGSAGPHVPQRRGLHRNTHVAGGQGCLRGYLHDGLLALPGIYRPVPR